LRRSGTQAARITLRNRAGQVVTVNSGNGKSLVTGGRVHFYTIEGLRFIASYVVRDLWDYTLNFGSNIWDGETDKDGGNNGFILRDCYVEGAVQFYGHNNLVENCELNGKNNWSNGLVDHFAASHDNIYRNNNVHDYKVRGIWSMQYTDDIVIEGNTVHHNGEQGIDCDGAGDPVYRCYVRNNIIHDISTAGVGILMENAFDSIVEGNRVYGLVTGIEVISYGLGVASVEYRTTDTNIVVRNNLVYDTARDGIICYGSPGGKALNNTIYNTNQTQSWFGAIVLTTYEGYYCHNWEIKNNIITQNHGAALWIESPSTGLNNFTSDYNSFDTNVKLTWKRWTGISYTEKSYFLSEWRLAFGQDAHSSILSP
jgi:hypothetical protein